MSVIGDVWTFLSVGASCQTAWQIQANITLLRQITSDETLRKDAFTFDWLICPPLSAAGMLRAGQFFPSTMQELSLNPGHAYWSKYGIYYWHDFVPNQPITFEAFSAARAKYAYLATKRERIARCKNLVLVISNTQNNLDSVLKPAKLSRPIISSAAVDDLRSAAELYFGRPAMLFIITRDSVAISPHSRAWRHPPDQQDWRGCSDQWAAALRSLITVGTWQ